MTIIISADEIKEQLPDYNPNEAETLHSQSAKLADKFFYQNLKYSLEKEVIIMAGGAASGKTEFLNGYLLGKYKKEIIFDTTLSTIIGAEIKIKKILKLKKTPVIYFILPEDLEKTYYAFLHRKRKFHKKHFHFTHSGSRKTLLHIAEKFSQVKINIYNSFYHKEGTKMHFKKLISNDLNNYEFLEILRKMQIDEKNIEDMVK